MDKKTLESAMAGDKKAFSKVYKEYFDGLWRYIYSRTKNKEVASDIVSESFIALYENIKNIRYARAIKSYLYRIAKNKMTKFFFEERSLSLSEFDLDRVEIKDREYTKRAEGLVVRLEEVLSRLPKRYEDVLRLRFLAGLKIREVAEVLGVSEGNVKVLQNRAIKKAQILVGDLCMKT